MRGKERRETERETTIFQRDRRWYDNEVSERFDRDRLFLVLLAKFMTALFCDNLFSESQVVRRIRHRFQLFHHFTL